MTSENQSALPRKQQLFCEEYIAAKFNGTEAYKQAGYRCRNDKVADACARKLLGKPRIQARIAQLMESRFASLEQKQVDVLDGSYPTVLHTSL